LIIWRILKTLIWKISSHIGYSRVIFKTGKFEKSIELVDKTLTVVRNRGPGNQLLLVDAIITKIEALRWSPFQLSATYSIKKLNGYLQLLEEGEKILENISNTEPKEKSERKVFYKGVRATFTDH
jgi:hypothetical protein